jgi:hypothetical protein
MTFKQYRKKVYRLTRKIKPQLLNEWDGYDFYDKQYIKDNFKLPFTHGDYPSIDHVKSLQKGFKEGIPPIEMSKKENLVWTKKRINSSKRTKDNYKYV